MNTTGLESDVYVKYRAGLGFNIKTKGFALFAIWWNHRVVGVKLWVKLM